MVKEGGVYEQQKSQDQSNGHGGSRSNGSGTLPGNSICSDRGPGSSGWNVHKYCAGKQRSGC